MISGIRCIVRNLISFFAMLVNKNSRNGANFQITRAFLKLARLALQPKAIGLVMLFVLGGLACTLLPPSYAQSSLPRFADSWNGVHAFLNFDPWIPYTVENIEYMQSIAWRFDFGFSAGKYLDALKAGNPGHISTLYVDAVEANQSLSWFQTFHPDWILYQCDRITPLRAYDYQAVIPDFSNPAYVDYKWNTEFLPRLGALQILEGVALDNGGVDNDFVPIGPGYGYGHACGAYNIYGQWIPKFNGMGSYAEVKDPAYTDAFIAYLAELKRRLNALSPPRLLVPNTYPKIVYNDPGRRANFMAAVDGVLIQGGDYGPDRIGDSRKMWLNHIHFVEDMNAVGKGVYDEQFEYNLYDETKTSPGYVRFVLASYLLAKGHHAAIKFASLSGYGSDSGLYWPTELANANQIGTPCAAMSQVAGAAGTEDGIFMREYTAGASLVNASLGTVYSATLPAGSSYRDVYGNPISSPVTMSGATGLVLLKNGVTSCSNSAPAPDTTPPTTSGISVTNITSSTATVNWTTNESADGQVEFISPCPSGCLMPLVSALTTAHAVNVSGLTSNTFYSYRVRSKDAAGNLAISSNQTFTTQATTTTTTTTTTPPLPSGTYSLWSNSVTPANITAIDPNAAEMGVKFKADVAGSISGIRFYKGPLNTGTHTVSLWTTAGALLARSVSGNETASGWQQITFATPVTIAPDTVYIASYHTTSGFYSYAQYSFTSQFDNGPLHALADGASGGNGVYRYSSTATFPSQNYRATNWFVDVMFNPSGTTSPVSSNSTYSFWDNSATPVNVSQNDGNAAEMGMKFRSDVNGLITAIRFYKGPQNTGTHTVSLWSLSGTLLARTVSTNETTSGWQQVNLPTPVNIAANTMYIVSYHTTSGYYSDTHYYFTNQYDSGPLHAPAYAPSGGNGVYKYSSVPTFPTDNYIGTNWFVDVVMQAQ